MHTRSQESFTTDRSSTWPSEFVARTGPGSQHKDGKGACHASRGSAQRSLGKTSDINRASIAWPSFRGWYDTVALTIPDATLSDLLVGGRLSCQPVHLCLSLSVLGSFKTLIAPGTIGRSMKLHSHLFSTRRAAPDGPTRRGDTGQPVAAML